MMFGDWIHKYPPVSGPPDAVSVAPTVAAPKVDGVDGDRGAIDCERVKQRNGEDAAVMGKTL